MSIKLRLLQPASAHLSLRDEILGSDIASSLETLDVRRHKHYGHTRLRHHASSLPWSSQCCHRLAAYLDMVRLWLRIHYFRSTENTSKKTKFWTSKNYGCLRVIMDLYAFLWLFARRIFIRKYTEQTQKAQISIICVFLEETPQVA